MNNSIDFRIFTAIISLCLFFNITVNTYSQTAIKNARVFDGKKDIENCTVLFSNGKITAVGKNISIPGVSEIIDGRGKTLLPGLFDAHVHVITPQALKQCLIFGVTTVIDMFMSVQQMNYVKKKQASGSANDMAYLVSPGTLVTAPDGHGTQYGLPIPTITKPEEAETFVRENAQ